MIGTRLANGSFPEGAGEPVPSALYLIFTPEGVETDTPLTVILVPSHRHKFLLVLGGKLSSSMMVTFVAVDGIFLLETQLRNCASVRFPTAGTTFATSLCAAGVTTETEPSGLL